MTLDELKRLAKATAQEKTQSIVDAGAGLSAQNLLELTLVNFAKDLDVLKSQRVVKVETNPGGVEVFTGSEPQKKRRGRPAKKQNA